MTKVKDTLQEFVSFEDLELLEKNILEFPCFTKSESHATVTEVAYIFSQQTGCDWSVLS